MFVTQSSFDLFFRLVVLGRLDQIVKDWIRQVAEEKNIPPNVADTGGHCGGKIYTFGSYRLGVHTKGTLFLNNFLILETLILKARGRDVRLRPYVADELGWFARDTLVMTQEQVGNVRESRGVRKMAASTCSVVSRPAPITPSRL